MNVWNIHPRDRDLDLPEAILTPRAPVTSSSLPIELAALLPTSGFDDAWLSKVPAGACAGLFLGNPLRQDTRTFKLLRDASIAWIANLPSVSQHDTDFIENLAEVGMGPEQELDRLARYQGEGFKCIASVSSAKDAYYAHNLGLKTICVLPQVRAYEGGFPSELVRNRAVSEVKDAIGDADATLLSIVTRAEAGARSVWPPQVSAVLERP